MIFVLVAPFLTNGLRRLGKQSHAALCVILMVMWGIVAGLSPIPLFHMQYDGLVSFLFLYTVISFYRWYMDDMTTKSAVLLVIIGCICIFGSILLMQLLGTRLHSVALRNMSNFLTSNSVKLPIMMVGFGILVLAERKVFHNSCINAIASTTFAIYLISDYPPVRTALWNSRFGLAAVYGAHKAILISLASIFVVCITCMIVDFMRQFLFTMTVDRHPGAWFDKLSEFVVTRHSLQQIAQSIAEKPTPMSTYLRAISSMIRQMSLFLEPSRILRDRRDARGSPSCPTAITSSASGYSWISCLWNKNPHNKGVPHGTGIRQRPSCSRVASIGRGANVQACS